MHIRPKSMCNQLGMNLLPSSKLPIVAASFEEVVEPVDRGANLGLLHQGEERGMVTVGPENGVLELVGLVGDQEKTREASSRAPKRKKRAMSLVWTRFR